MLPMSMSVLPPCHHLVSTAGRLSPAGLVRSAHVVCSFASSCSLFVVALAPVAPGVRAAHRPLFGAGTDSMSRSTTVSGVTFSESA